MPLIVCKPITIDTKLIGKQLDDFVEEAAKDMNLAATSLRKTLATEPASKYIPWNHVGGSPPAYASKRQQTFVIMSVKEGLMDAPYQRTNELSNAWTVDEQRTKMRITYTIKNELPKAQWMYDKAKKVYRAKEVGWPTVEDVAEKDWPKMAKQIEASLASWQPK